MPDSHALRIGAISTLLPRSATLAPGSATWTGSASPAWRHERSYRGFNLFSGQDRRCFEAISRGEFNLRGFKSSDLRRVLPYLTASQTGRLLKRLRLHGIIKKKADCYRYYLTTLGRKSVTAALKVREFVMIPTLATALS